jgi:predicted Zn-ribbon and HTH transcriptional regulator
MTRRQQIIEILQQSKQTAQQLANYFQCELKDMIEDLQHIEKSIKPNKLKIEPAYCKSCNFVFKERSKISKPSKCPRCKSEWIEAQMFWIE